MKPSRSDKPYLQTYTTRPDGTMHAGPVNNCRPSVKAARKHERKWVAWRLIAFGERHRVSDATVTYVDDTTGKRLTVVSLA